MILKLTSIYQLTDDAYLKVWMHTQAYNALIPVTPDRRHYYQAKPCLANPRGMDTTKYRDTLDMVIMWLLDMD